MPYIIVHFVTPGTSLRSEPISNSLSREYVASLDHLKSNSLVAYSESRYTILIQESFTLHGNTNGDGGQGWDEAADGGGHK